MIVPTRYWSCRMTPLLVLPGSCHPQPEELFSSWLTRLATNHQMSAKSFLVSLVGPATKPILQRKFYDMDRNPLSLVLETLATRTLTSRVRIEQTTLGQYERFVIPFKQTGPDHNPYKSRFTWLLPFGHAQQYACRASFCPGCLAKDGVRPYYRIPWRMSFSVACLACQVMLADQCPNCSFPINYYQFGIAVNPQLKAAPLNPSIAICHHCGHNLAQTPTLVAPAVVLEGQRTLQRLSQGVGLEPDPAACHYFFRLRQLLGGLISFHRGCHKQPVPKLLVMGTSGITDPRKPFEALSVVVRARLLQQAMALLEAGFQTRSYPWKRDSDRNAHTRSAIRKLLKSRCIDGLER